MKTKIMRSLACSESGFVKESIDMLMKAFNQKDMPIKWLEETEYLKR